MHGSDGQSAGHPPPVSVILAPPPTPFAPQIKELLKDLADARVPVPDFLCEAKHVKLAPADESDPTWEVYHVDSSATTRPWEWDLLPRLKWSVKVLALDMWVHPSMRDLRHKVERKPAHTQRTQEKPDKLEHKPSKVKNRRSRSRSKSRRRRQSQGSQQAGDPFVGHGKDDVGFPFRMPLPWKVCA